MAPATVDPERGLEPDKRAPLLACDVSTLLAPPVVFGSLYLSGMAGGAPAWLLAGACLGIFVMFLRPVRRWFDAGRLRRRLCLSGGLVVTFAEVATFRSGWGQLAASALILHVTLEIRVNGGWAWRPMLCWCVLVPTLGQVLVLAGIWPSYLSVGIGNAAFLLGLTAMALVAREYGMTTELAEAEAAGRENEILARKMTEARFRSLVENSHDLVILATTTGEVTWVSASATSILGHSPEAILQTGWTHLMHPEDLGLAADLLAKTPVPGGRSVAVMRAKHGDGTWHWFEFTSANRLDDPAVGAIVFNVRDVSDNHAFQDQLSHQATRDSLTGLLNRSAFLERLESALARTRRKDNPAAVLFLDLDDFKAVNDQWGHHAGDILLQTVAQRLLACVRPGDSVGRLGGDEFVVLLEDLASMTGGEVVADRIHEALRSPIILDGHPVAPTASIGVAVTTTRLESADELLHAADLRMYLAKQGATRRPRRRDLAAGEFDTASIERALAAGEFFLEYQPVVDLTTGRSSWVEALVRWNHPTLGRLAPDRFIPRIEALGLMAALGRRVLEDGCRTVGGWADDPRLPPITLAINASVSQLRDPSFPMVVRQVLAETGFPAGRLVIEVTESLPVTPQDEALTTLAALTALGVRIALDDFGAGYASLAQLDLVCAQIVKLDRQLIARVDESPDGFLQGLITFLLSLGVTLVAEGIETAAQQRAIAATGARYAQGYHLARPTSADQVVELLTARFGDQSQPARGVLPLAPLASRRTPG